MAKTKLKRRWAMIAGAVAAVLAALALVVSSAAGTGSQPAARTGSSATKHHAVFVRAKVYKHGLDTKVSVRPAVHRDKHAKAAHKPKHHKGKKRHKGGLHPAGPPVAGDSGTVK